MPKFVFNKPDGTGTHTERLAPYVHGSISKIRDYGCLICHKHVLLNHVAVSSHLARHVKSGHLTPEESLHFQKSVFPHLTQKIQAKIKT